MWPADIEPLVIDPPDMDPFVIDPLVIDPLVIDPDCWLAPGMAPVLEDCAKAVPARQALTTNAKPVILV